MVKESLTKKNWFIITLFCFMGRVAWNTENMYFNTFITNEIYADVSQAAILSASKVKSVLGIPTEFHAYDGLSHGFGLGTGTVAEGWLNQSVSFWKNRCIDNCDIIR